jgi:hemolysin III
MAGDERRPQSTGEEIANAVSHGVGLVAALGAAPALIAAAARQGGPAAVFGASVFAASMALLYLASTLYHSFPAGRAKRALRVLDHGAIYLLIAGTYTPFTLGALRGPWGWTLLGLVWGLALFGISWKALARRHRPAVSTALYVTMGWLVLIAAGPLVERVPLSGVLWLVAGGIAYTAGVAFFALHRVRYAHFLWHLMVLAGTVCHFMAVLGYAA